MQSLLIDTTGLEAVSHLIGDLSGVVSGSTFIDLRDIHSRMGGEFRRVLDVLSIVDESAHELLGMIDSANIALDIDGLKSVAHALKGVFLEVGAPICAEMAWRVESIVPPIDFDQAQKLLLGLRRSVLIIADITKALLSSEK